MSNRYRISDMPEKDAMQITDTITGRSFLFPASSDGIIAGAIRELIDTLRQWSVAESDNDRDELANARAGRDAALRSFGK